MSIGNGQLITHKSIVQLGMVRHELPKVRSRLAGQQGILAGRVGFLPEDGALNIPILLRTFVQKFVIKFTSGQLLQDELALAMESQWLVTGENEEQIGHHFPCCLYVDHWDVMFRSLGQKSLEDILGIL